MANETILNKGTKLTLGATGTTSSISNDAFQECTDDTRTSADDAGYTLGIFEFKTAAGGFSTAPTAGANIKIFEQKINSGSNDAPDVDANYEHDLIATLHVDPADAQQYLTVLAPIHRDGGKYWVKWEDGGAGTASVDAAWELTLTPCAYGTA